MTRSTMSEGASVRSLYAWDELGRLAAVATGRPVTWTGLTNATAESATGDVAGAGSLNGTTWDGGAVSAQNLTGDGAVSFRLPSVPGPVVGLNTSSSSTWFGEIDYAIHRTWQGHIQVYEHGAQRCGSACEFFTDTEVDDTDVFTIERIGSTVRYLRNGIVFYTSSVAATANAYLVDVSLSSTNDRLRDVIITAGNRGVQRHVYDTTGQRFLRVEPDGTKTVYLGATELRWTPGTSTVQAARSYPGGMRRGYDGTLSFNPTGHQGSVLASVNATTGAIDQHRYLPYGNLRRGTGVDDHGFLNQIHDHTNLIYLNNRYHDPNLGMFVSVDPLVSLTGEPYIYGSGNPTTLSDPTGLCADAVYGWYDDGKGACPKEGTYSGKGIEPESTGVLGWWRKPADQLDLSWDGSEMLHSWEGVGPNGLNKAYDDPTGNCTVGIGHLVHMGGCSQDEFDRFYSDEEIWELLQRDVDDHSALVDDYLEFGLSQWEFDAIVIFLFQQGPEALGASKNQGILDAIQVGPLEWDLDEIYEEWSSRFTSSAPKGIIRRRAAEALLFTTGTYTFN